MLSPLKITRVILLVITYWLLVTFCYAGAPKYIRVAIIQDAASLRIKVKGFYEVMDAQDNKILSRGKNLNTTVTLYREGILLGNIKSKNGKLFIKSDDPGAIIIDGRLFRGNIQLLKKDNLHLLAINDVELEDYIKGVLYHEVSHYWPMEALMAQAIVCRTYAVYQMQENRLKAYDVTSDVYSQVYGGRLSERYRPSEAVDATKDEVLTYQGKVFPAYYHATCAGHTEDASLVWNIDTAPLKGVPCNFCRESPHFKWHAVLSTEEIKERLKDKGYKTDNIKDILIPDRDKSDRIKTLRIITDKKNIDILAKDFRNIIGPNIIKSTNFKVSLMNQDMVFEGFGWGHGVGLCQWGAYFMAKQGYNYKEILKYYYPHSDVKTFEF